MFIAVRVRVSLMLTEFYVSTEEELIVNLKITDKIWDHQAIQAFLKKNI